MNVIERTTRAVVKFQKFYFWISCLRHCCWCPTRSFEREIMSFRWKNHHHLLTFGAAFISDNDSRLLSDNKKTDSTFHVANRIIVYFVSHSHAYLQQTVPRTWFATQQSNGIAWNTLTWNVRLPHTLEQPCLTGPFESILVWTINVALRWINSNI